MLVAICTEYFHPTGGATGKALYGLVEALLEKDDSTEYLIIRGDRNHWIDATTCFNGKEGRRRIYTLKTLKVDRSRMWKRLLADVDFTIRVALQLLLMRRPDAIIVVSNPFLLPIAAWLTLTLRGVPYLYILHDLYPEIAEAAGLSLPKQLRRVLARAQRGWLRSAAKVVVLGRCMKERVIQIYEVIESRAVLIPNWADINVSVTAASRSIGPGLDIQDGDFVALYSGNMGRFHDLDTLISGAAEGLRKGMHFRIVMAGDGARRRAVEQRVRDLQLTNVRVIDYVAEEKLPELLSIADVGIVSLSRGAEGYAVPMKLYNLLAAGRPIIAICSPFSEVARVVEEVGCGFRVDQGDVNGLLDAITKLRAEPQVKVEMGRRAKEAAKAYTLEAAAEQYYREIARMELASSRGT